jgi:hypothetical protein
LEEEMFISANGKVHFSSCKGILHTSQVLGLPQNLSRVTGLCGSITAPFIGDELHFWNKAISPSAIGY